MEAMMGLVPMLRSVNFAMVTMRIRPLLSEVDLISSPSADGDEKLDCNRSNQQQKLKVPGDERNQDAASPGGPILHVGYRPEVGFYGSRRIQCYTTKSVRVIRTPVQLQNLSCAPILPGYPKLIRTLRSEGRMTHFRGRLLLGLSSLTVRLAICNHYLM